MKERTRYFLLGTLTAGVITAVTSDLSGLEAVGNRVAKPLTPELRLAIDLGILESSDVRLGLVDVPVSRKDFARIIQQTLFMMGSPVGGRLKDLGEAGIFEIGAGRKTLSRKQALEAMCRVAISLQDNGFLSYPTGRSEGFSDYQAPEKYASALRYLQDKLVVRGYPNGMFGAARAISKREAVTLFYRLYEQVVFERSGGTSAGVKGFVDIPVDHPVRPDLELIDIAGGFNRTSFGISFDGNGSISRHDAVEMVKGIVAKQGKLDESMIPLIQQPLAALSRREMAIMLDGLLPPPPPDSEQDVEEVDAKGDGAEDEIAETEGESALRDAMADDDASESAPPGQEPSAFAYVDVPAGSAESKALENLARHKIFLGYSDGRMNGQEKVSRFEIVGVLASVLRAAGVTMETPKPEPLATKTDIQEFAEMLRAKKARIRAILDKKPSREQS